MSPEVRALLVLLISTLLVSHAQSEDIRAVLDSTDGSTAFVVTDSETNEQLRAGSDGVVSVNGTLSVSETQNRGSLDRAMLIIGGGDDIEIGAGANGYLTGVAVGKNANGYLGGAVVGAGAYGVAYGAAVGFNANALSDGAAAGRSANGSHAGVAVGAFSSGYAAGIAIGNSACGSQTNIAIGNMASSGVGPERIAIGHMVATPQDNAAAIRGTLFLDGGTNVMMRSTFGSGAWVPLSSLAGDFKANGSVPMSGNLNLAGQVLTNVALVDFNSSSTAVGRGADAGLYGTALGYGTVATNRGTAVGYISSAYGYGAAVGRESRGYSYGAAIGENAWGYENGVAVGYWSDGYAGGVALGYHANGAKTNIAIGGYAHAYGTDRIAIGRNVTNQVNNSAAIRGTLYLDGGTGIMTRSTFGTGGWTAKAFTIPHPLDPENRILRHFCMEGPEVWNVYAGNAHLVDGKAVVELPAYYSALNKAGSEIYSLTPIGEAFVWVAEEVADNRFTIAGKQDIKVSWTVKALRNDPACRADIEQRPVEQNLSEIAPGQMQAENTGMNTMP
ncbi:MAG TPA: hypothetical protein PKM67_05270 [Kiritimatiellia bacterium]|nr:hypothetical protein [Kiritimatiellia bacterium]HPA78795.1 hypothetical protein [Kiritimatiellia bacterium]